MLLRLFFLRHHRHRRLVIDAMKGAIGLSQDVLMRGRDWLTNTKRKKESDEDEKRRTKKRQRLSLYGKATVEEIRADYARYAECLTARKNMYLANIDEPNSLINFMYLDSYEAQQLPCTAWYDTSLPARVRTIAIRVSVGLCLSVCLSVRAHILKPTCPNFTKLSVHVTCGRGSVLL